MNKSSKYIILNGKLIPTEKAEIPAITSGLFYGAGAFETFAAEYGKIFKFNEHIERLRDGLEYLGVPKEKNMKGDDVLGQIRKLLKKTYLLEETARIRIQASLTEKQGYSCNDDCSYITIISSTKTTPPRSPQSLILSETSVVPDSARPARYKLSNTLHYRHAYREAEQKSADDAVLVTSDGLVAETSIANIFWMKDGEIYTPSEDCDILPGIMRKSLIDIFEEMQLEVKAGRFSMDELLQADLVWITNSAIDFVSVGKIEEIFFETESSFFSDLREKLAAYKEENMTDV